MIIVTGGAGFIGSAIVWKLNSKNISDIIIVDEFGVSENWRNLVGLDFREYLHKSEFIDLILQNNFKHSVEAIFHMGACSTTTETDMDYLFKNNTQYSQVLAQWAVDRGIRMILASSAATYGAGDNGFDDDHDKLEILRPINRYGYSKHRFDIWAKQNGFLSKLTVIKFFNVFGPNEYHKGDMRSVVCKAYQEILNSGTLRLFKSHRSDYEDGEQKRDFLYIKDCVNVIWELFINHHATGIFNVGTGKARTWNELAAAVFNAMKKNNKIAYIAMPDLIRNQYQYWTEANIQKLRTLGCKISFTTLEDAAADYVQNYLSRSQHHL